MKMIFAFLGLYGCWLPPVAYASTGDALRVEQTQFEVPVLTRKDNNAVLRLKVVVPAGESTVLTALTIGLAGTSNLHDVKSVDVIYTGVDSMMSTLAHVDRFGSATSPGAAVAITGRKVLPSGVHFFWVSYTLADGADLLGRISSACNQALFGTSVMVPIWDGQPISQRIGVAVRQHGQDGVHTSRIPGLATTNKGTLLAVFDARYESDRDLQGHMDIGLHRSTDGGRTWEPLQIAIDMGEWGGLPQRYNGVSDACILIDTNSDAIYIAGLWMHGVLDEAGNWVEGLGDGSEEWNHQWRDSGSQPGFGVKQTAQFLIVKSTDDGQTWGEPVNLTQGKQEAWWLWAPAPGRGITMRDGTLVFPTEGRDETGKSFSNLTYSTDGGKTWRTSNPALDGGTTECAVVELTDGAMMLNMRGERNWTNTADGNGRAVAITRDMGVTWQEHHTSFGALPEPTCMASLHVHTYEQENIPQRLLLFVNPNSKTARNRMTLKASFDDGDSWPEVNWLVLDEWDCRGYSCITSVDNDHIGILYESSQAELVFQKIPLKEIAR